MIDLKLPKFQMTSFDGDVSKWTSFWDVFNSSIHSRTNLTNALNFTYLKGFLTGKAAKAIEGITVSNDNYMDAVQILQDRFGDAAFIKESLWEKLREMSHHKSYHLSETVDSIEQIIRQLKALGEDTTHPFFCQMVQQALPRGTMADLERKREGGTAWQMGTLMTALRDIIKTRERVQRYEKEFSSQSSRFPQANQMNTAPRFPSRNSGMRFPPWNQVNRTPYSWGSSPVTNPFPRFNSQTRREFTTTDSFGVTSRRPPSRPCAFCQKIGHYNEDCSEYPPATRKQRAYELQLCVLCLGKNHGRNECPSFTRSCAHCGKQENHNRALCNLLRDTRKPYPIPGKAKAAASLTKNDEVQEDDSNTDQSGALEKRQPPSTNGNSNLAASTQDNESSNETMLLLAKAYVRNPANPRKLSEARLFLNTGSQRSFISQELVNKLGLTEEADPISLHRFATKKAQQISSSLVQFEILLRDGTVMKINANSLPHLITSIDSYKLSKEDMEALETIPDNHLASEKPGTQKMKKDTDILIGNNFFWKFILPQQITQLPSGLFLIPS
ncbi:MAG: DUF1759 domain-containing protein, partial [Gammaproteobacteria bacterium]|nr:DUF1759 domain-containing protein [Gammaproteobacteria bacterium]